MQKLSYLIVLILIATIGFAESPHGSAFKIDCAVCHKADSWKVMRTDMAFNHNTTRFKLTGQHQSIDCKSCHQTLKFQEAKSECIACHTDMHSNTLGTDCARCHTPKAWIIEDTKTMHLQSRFPLTGNHALVDCASCHKSSSNYRFEPLGVECVDCHRKDYLATTNPNHQKLNYPVNCLECHDVRVTAWKTTTFDHSTFPLINGHNLSCIECHTSGNYQKISTECSSCHQVNYTNTQNPNHSKAGISTDCKTCHTNTTWQTTTFNHNTTGFSLTGAHTGLQCSSCHLGNTTSAKPECNSCHKENYLSVKEPSHIEAGISEDCKTCHTTTIWNPSTFKHSTTGFELKGAHSAIVQCSSCHVGNTTSAKPECISCHQVQYNNAKGHVDSNFPTDCRLCHNNENWLGATFDHTTTGFPLTGSHVSVDCASCHKTGYAGTSSECKSCHQTNYNSAQVPSHSAAGISTDCKICHTATDWKPSTFKHSTTGFDLTGAHSAIVQCSTCHVGNTTSAKPECISCHQAQYNGAKDHVALQFPTNCKLCHSSTSWLGATFDHTQTAFPLTGSHVSVECASCHKSGYTGTSMECKSCHQANYNSAQVPSHSAAGISTDCKTCHTTTDWKPSTFKHSTTGFDLTGAHSAIIQCSTCHVGNTTSAKPECISCHQAQYNSAPGHVASSFPTDCKLCHSSTSWLGATFDHTKTGFPLTGSHTSVDCKSCHKSGYTGTSSECKSCHQTNYNSAQVPSHSAAGISTDCKTCHTTTDWKPSTFKHSTTGFDLTGAHSAIIQCSTCHVGNTTSAKPECISCHQTQYNGAPGHVASSFPTDCKLCHSSTSWSGATFDHSKTAFPLTGSHVSVDCASCHKSGYTGTSMECKSCHQANYNSAQVPSHSAAGISTDCKTCHTTTDWKPSTFKHSTTGFDLTGAHSAIIQCSTCHVGNTTSAKPECISCHQTQYNGAPGHVASSFPTDCKLCHSSTSWLGATFDHSKTAFPLTGSHTSVDCVSCHKTGYAGTSMECKSCHQANYNSAQVPSHSTAGISTDCKTCHTTTDWKPSSFKHSTTGFDLTGAHSAIVQCSSCHVGNTTSAQPECISCHQAQYNTAPSHVASSFPTDCRLCHNNTNWLGATFDHTKTAFPLTGSHVSVDCASCHKTGYAGTSTDCSSCHLTNYNLTTNPNHKTLGLSTSCATCHTTNPGWQPASFAIHNNYYALTGAHAAISTNCVACHKGNYTTTPNTCYACHTTDYNNTTNPAHKAAQFPTDCATCHTVNAWAPSTFNHDSQYFPIYSGKHRGVWTKCSECHTSATNFTVFSCIICHEHSNKTNVDGHHSGVTNYVYNGTSCYTCHPTGRSD